MSEGEPEVSVTLAENISALPLDMVTVLGVTEVSVVWNWLIESNAVPLLVL